VVGFSSNVRPHQNTWCLQSQRPPASSAQPRASAIAAEARQRAASASSTSGPQSCPGGHRWHSCSHLQAPKLNDWNHRGDATTSALRLLCLNQVHGASRQRGAASASTNAGSIRVPGTSNPVRAAWPLRQACGSINAVNNLHRSKVWPNPSLKAPTHYGRQRKPGTWHSCIITYRAYAACLRGRL
jgi:hypothetical protein